MSISLDNAGQIVLTSSGTGANSYKMTLSAPTSLAQNVAVGIPDAGGDCKLLLSRKPAPTAAGVSGQ